MKNNHWPEPPKITFRPSEDYMRTMLNLFTDEMLEREMAKAVELEQYEMAAYYRDELSDRKKAMLV